MTNTIYIIFQFIIPPPEPLAKAGMGMLGVFISTLYLWVGP